MWNIIMQLGEKWLEVVEKSSTLKNNTKIFPSGWCHISGSGSSPFDEKNNMRTAIVTRNAFNKSQNQINIQCGVLVREAKQVQSLFSKEFLALVVNACIAKAGKKVKGSFRAWQNSNHARMKKTSQMSCVCRSYTNTLGWNIFWKNML